MTLELIGGIVAALAILVSAIFGKNKSYAVTKAQQETDKAKAEVVTVKAEMAKEKIKHETEKKLAAVAALSDNDIIADALGEYRAGRPSGSQGSLDSEGADTNRQ